MSQLFYVRRENDLGLAIIDFEYDGTLKLLDLYPKSDSDLDNFVNDLSALVRQHGVEQVYATSPNEPGLRPRDYSELKHLPEVLDVAPASKPVPPIEGRIARHRLKQNEAIDETPYSEHKKLSARIDRSKEASTVGADLEAYFYAIVLASPPDDDVSEICGFAEDALDFRGLPMNQGPIPFYDPPYYQ